MKTIAFMKTWIYPILAITIPAWCALNFWIPISVMIILSGVLYLILCGFSLNNVKPDKTLLKQELPDQALHNQAYQDQILPDQAISNQSISNQAASNQAIFGNLLPVLVPISILGCSIYYLFSDLHSFSVDWIGLQDINIQMQQNLFPNSLFFAIFCLALIAGLVFASIKSARPLEISGALIYGGAAIGITLTTSLMTVFVLWEVMLIGSMLILWASDIAGARESSFRYLLMHVFGGVLFFIGLSIMHFNNEPLLVTHIEMKHLGHYLVLIGVLVNIAAPPFWAWVADSYPKASPSGSVFLSAFTTKTAVFVLLMLFNTHDILIYLGIFMVIYGIIYALNCRNMRQILAYCIVSQLGYMVIGIGVGTKAALIAVSIQAVAHILYKGLLMMSAGSVLYEDPENDIHALGNRCETLPFTALFAIIGGLALSAIPLSLTFASKTLLMYSLESAETDQNIIFILALASGAAPLYIGIRWPWLVFFKDSSFSAWMQAFKNTDIILKEIPNVLSYLLLAIPLIYLTPITLANLGLLDVIPDSTYKIANIIHQFQAIIASFLVFIVVKNWIIPDHHALYDFDTLYRKVGFKNITLSLKILRSINGRFEMMKARLYKKMRPLNKAISAYIRYFGDVWPSSAMVIFACITLTITLVLLYIK
ncbi:hypothetical protein AwWohl_01020 [Gammaproteobacteria bacterium]|nr:hypothetical protein AwWohl_01020 [Gammaproteobacteria bacterium]